MLEDVEERYPAHHYVMIDDKLRILAAMKNIWGDRVTTVFPRQGHYAAGSEERRHLSAADVALEQDRRSDRLRPRHAPRRVAATFWNGGNCTMNPIQQLRDVGQSIWLDNITRDLLNSGTLGDYLDRFSLTGLTSNPSIFDHAIGNSTAYDEDIQRNVKAGKRGEEVFFELALADLTRAADLFRPIHNATGGVDGWVSLEVSPLLANDTAADVNVAALASDLQREGTQSFDAAWSDLLQRIAEKSDALAKAA